MSPEILMSNMNVSKADALRRGGAWYGDFADKAGYEGIEFTPVRGPLLREARLGRVAALDVIRSTHQSFVPDMFALPFSVVMPQMEKSLDQLAEIQARLPDRRVPVVVYPNQQMPPRTYVGLTNFAARHDLGDKLWQVTSEVLEAWEVQHDETELAIAALARRMESEGLDGCVIDTHHSYAPRGGTTPDWDKWLPLMDQQGLIDEVHVSPARSDMGGGNDELRAILAGHIQATRTGAVLGAIHPQRIVTEIPAGEMTRLGYKDIAAVHRDITAALRDHIAA